MIALLSAAWACETDGGLPEGPVAASLWDGALGRAQSACPRAELAVAPHAYLLADTPAFYGVVAASGVLEGSAVLDRRTELGVRLELVRYQNVISAISSSYTGLGYTTLSATRRVDPSAVARSRRVASTRCGAS